MELRRLHDRVRSLETELVRLRAENDALLTRVTDHDLITLDVKESVLA